jgi:beta-lactamase class A
MVNCKTGAKRLRASLPGTWKIGDKTGNNGKDASGDIVVAWPKADTPILIAAYNPGRNADRGADRRPVRDHRQDGRRAVGMKRTH